MLRTKTLSLSQYSQVDRDSQSWSLKMNREVFPVVYSTLSSNALASLILPHYNINLATCQLWHRGLSDVYLVETQIEPYILRVSHNHWRSKSEIDFELELLDFLRKRNLPVAYPIRTNDGKLSIEINAPEGKRYATLFQYAPGQIPVGDLNEKQSHNLGATVAKIHQAAADFRCNHRRQPLTLEYLLDNSLDLISPFLHQRTNDMDYLKEVIGKIKHQLQNFPQEEPFWVICWGDPHSGNAHFTSDDRVTLFDFDQCGYGWRAFEIAKFLQVSVRTGISKKVRDAFMSGYQSIESIADAEIASLQAFTQTAHIWNWAISVNSATIHDYSSLDDLYFTKRLEQLKMLCSKDWQLF